MPDSQLTGMTDQRLGIPVLPLTRFLLPAVVQLATTVAGALPCAVSTRQRPRYRSPDLPVILLACALRKACCLTAKTLETHQGTSVFLLLLFLKSTKLSRLYLVCFQPSAARPQVHA